MGATIFGVGAKNVDASLRGAKSFEKIVVGFGFFRGQEVRSRKNEAKIRRLAGVIRL